MTNAVEFRRAPTIDFQAIKDLFSGYALSLRDVLKQKSLIQMDNAVSEPVQLKLTGKRNATNGTIRPGRSKKVSWIQRWREKREAAREKVKSQKTT